MPAARARGAAKGDAKIMENTNFPPRRRRRQHRSNAKKWILLAAVSVLLIAVTVLGFGFWKPYLDAENAMPQSGELVIRQESDGSLTLSWPEAERTDSYCLEIFAPTSSEEEMPELLYKNFITDGTSCTLPKLPDDMALTMQINTVVHYKTLAGERLRFGEDPMSVTTTFKIPRIDNLRWKPDPDTNTVGVEFIMQEGDHCRCYLSEDGVKTQLYDLLKPAMLLSFGDDGDLPIPKFGQTCSFVFDAYREEPGLKFYGYYSAEMMIERDHLLGRNLNLVCTDDGYNVSTLTWDETKGDVYAVQRFDKNTESWVTIEEIPGDGVRKYTTAHMAPFRSFTYRVVALGGQTMPDSEYAAISDEITVETRQSPIYATVWPVKELTAFRDAGMTDADGKVKTGTPLCVLTEVGGAFGVRVGGEIRYIDSNYCLINLPEYMGDLCSYEITNSYDSKYMIHEFEIPEVTGVVTGGYERVKLTGGDFLVPLLYPTARKLVNAAESAIEQGYRLKIYDAFRPNKATREIYDLTEKILDEPLPEKPYTNVKISSLDLPKPKAPEPDPENPDEVPEPVLTYKMVMTLDKYGLTYFLAKGGSLHNLGIALDLTIEDLETGEELKMQSSMHDLSAYSVLGRNNSAAKTLAKIMKGAGFGDLVSEWWHFQDNDTRNALKPPTVSGGVHGECWVADDFGWRYRTKTGAFYTDTTVTIDGEACTFDENGYLVE